MHVFCERSGLILSHLCQPRFFLTQIPRSKRSVVQNDEQILFEIQSECFPLCFPVKTVLFYQNNFNFVSVNYSEGCRKFPTKTGVRLVKVPLYMGLMFLQVFVVLLKISLFRFAFKCLKSIRIASNAYTLPR